MSGILESQAEAPNFDNLKAELIRHPEGLKLHEDIYFPAKYQILFNKINIEFDSTEIVWRRPGQLSKIPVLLESTSDDNPVKYYQGKLTPFWFPILIAVLKERDLFDLVVPNLSSQSTFDEDPNILTPASMCYCGAFQFCFRRGGVLEYIIIDDRLPTTINCHLLSAISSNNNEFLPALIEKAYAKFVGGYYNLEKETFLSALMDFTGGLAESIGLNINEDISVEEIAAFYKNVVEMSGDSFVLCQIDLHNSAGDNKFKKQSSTVVPYQIFTVNGCTEIPMDPPDGLVTDLINIVNNTRGTFIPAMRLLPLANFQENSTVEKHILYDWQKCTSLVKMKYGLECNNNKENWILVKDLVHISAQIVILHMYSRSSLIAVAKQQIYWKYNFFENFWTRDGPRGNMDQIGTEFCRNNQYLLVVDDDEGCSIKIVLTNVQKYIDTGANAIQSGAKTIIGIALLEVEKNRIYRMHDLDHMNECGYNIDFYGSRYLIVSAILERGRYVIIPWISAGPGTKYTLQTFSTSIDTEITYLDQDIPKQELCVTCQIKQMSLYRRDSLEYDTPPASQKKGPLPPADICPDCRDLYPKRATRISVQKGVNIDINETFQLPNFSFQISCENETFISKTVRSTLDPLFDEHFIFYRKSEDDSGVNIQLFCENLFGFKWKIFSYDFSEKELRDKSNLTLSLEESSDSETKASGNKLLVEIRNYFPSEFIDA